MLGSGTPIGSPDKGLKEGGGGGWGGQTVLKRCEIS